MTHSKVSTLISLIQWRLDEGIALKDAYNTVVTNFHEGVTESERQELLEHFSPSVTLTTVRDYLLDEWFIPSTEYLQALESLVLVYSTDALHPYALIDRVYYVNRDLLNAKFFI